MCFIAATGSIVGGRIGVARFALPVPTSGPEGPAPWRGYELRVAYLNGFNFILSFI